MSGRTWVMMLVVLAINWGGFIGALAYGIRRDSRRQSTATGTDGVQPRS